MAMDMDILSDKIIGFVFLLIGVVFINMIVYEFGYINVCIKELMERIAKLEEAGSISRHRAELGAENEEMFFEH